MSKVRTIFGVLLLIVGLVLLLGAIGNSANNSEKQAINDQKLQESISEMDRIVNKAIVHCQTDGMGCDIIMADWQGVCQEENMKNIPSCHDGRIQEWIANPVLNEEYEELKELKNSYRHEQYLQDVADAFESQERNP